MVTDTSNKTFAFRIKGRSGELMKKSSTVTSCIALYSMALWPGLSSVSISLQQGQRASSLMSDQRRSVSRAGKRAECNGLRRHRLSTESWSGGEKCSDGAANDWNSVQMLWKGRLTSASFVILDKIWNAWREHKEKNNCAAKLSRTSHLKNNSQNLMTRRCVVASHNFFEEKTKEDLTV